jgi:hypothetical protein
MFDCLLVLLKMFTALLIPLKEIVCHTIYLVISFNRSFFHLSQLFNESSINILLYVCLQ